MSENGPYLVYTIIAAVFVASSLIGMRLPIGKALKMMLAWVAIFAVGFFMRPIGAWLMGIYSDRHGRKSGLALSVALMAGGSLLIAAAPTYARAGAIAPICESDSAAKSALSCSALSGSRVRRVQASRRCGVSQFGDSALSLP